MIREETDIKGLSARLNAQPFSNVYALSALAGYPASGGFYAAYSAGPGALVLCGGAAYPYRPAGADAAEAAQFLRLRGVRSAVGDARTVRALAAHLPGSRLAECSLLILRGAVRPGPQTARLCGRAEQPQVYALLRACFDGLPGFQEYMDAKDQQRYYLGGRTAVCEQDGRIAASGSILCATDRAALLGALACAPQYRGRGCARAVVHALCLAAEGRTPCLLAEPDRLGLYARLGFHSGCAMAQLIME